MVKSVEKMGLPALDEGTGEMFDLNLLYEGIHIKEQYLRTFAQEPDTMMEAVKERVLGHMGTCPRNEKTGRPSCQEKYEEYRLKQQSLIE